MDRLTSLTAFVRVVECGGFSAAARRLNLSVTMVSNHVQALEDRLAVRLLNRTTRRVSLTDAGRAYYDRCITILADLEAADELAVALNATPRGTLRLHIGTHLARFIAPVIGDFVTRYPAISVELTIGEASVDIVDEGFDLAVHPLQPQNTSLICRRLTPWRHVLCAAPAYLEKHGTPQSLEDLANHNCLRYSHYPFGNEWRFIGPEQAGVSARVSGNLVTNSAETLLLVALSGEGLLLLPSFIVLDDLRSGALCRLLPDHRPVEFAINAIYPHRDHLSTKVRTFIDLLAMHFARHREWLNPFDPTSARSEAGPDGLPPHQD
ncbi:LysR family transcriptional regulator [Azospirillum formosense]|uniref:LysR family transcriptional regulator n=1 Tax=Azospirillum formosense TaxID=861533 RepID=UPI001C90D446|nr:LysR family transcriptional regulator [Azospirillum formosense]